MKKLVMLLLFLVQTEKGIVTGRIVNADGSPAAGVRVAAMAVTETRLESITQTDNSGSYRLESVTPGPYYITTGLVP